MAEAVRETDTVIIGAGPIGLEMAVALKEAGVDYVQLEARQVGHTISWFPRQARFFSSPDRIAICGVPLLTVDQSKASREEYLTYLLSVVQLFGLQIQCYERVTHIERHRERDRPFLVHTQRADGPRAYRAGRLIFAIGDMHGPRRLVHPTLPAVPGEELGHVSHYFDEPHPYVGQKLLIVGGRNSAVEAAIRCHRAGAHVALSYRRAAIDPSVKYWLKPEIEWLIHTGAIPFYPNTLPVKITATQVELAPTDASGKFLPDSLERTTSVDADFVLLLIGYQMDPSLLELIGVELEGPSRRPVIDPETNQTNVPGVYVAGTAAAGTQIRFKLFIENCHSHVVRITRHITGKDPTHINPLAYSRLHEDPLAAES